MFDRDIHPRFQEAIDPAHDNEIHLAISNPYFEIWEIFHYGTYDALADRYGCQLRFRELSPGYARRTGKTFDDVDLIETRYRDPVERARNSLARRAEQGDPGVARCLRMIA